VTLPGLVWLILATIWGSTWLFIKVGLEDLPPITFAGLRFVIAATPLLVWMVVRRVPLPRSGADWRLMLGTGFLIFTVNYTLLGMVMAHFMLPEEPLTVRKAGGALLAAAGVALIFYNQIEARGPLALAGSVAIVLAATGTAYADVLIKRSGAHIAPVTMTTVQMVSAVLPMLAVGTALEGNPAGFAWTRRAVFALCYLALLGSSLTFVLLYWLIQRTHVTRTMLIPFFSTLIAVLLGGVVLGERLSWRVGMGGAAILIGLLIAVRAGGVRRAATPTPAPTPR
jgi:drug/metabolite transporter (DMT)-like permease